jgi:hypothetical protein
MKYPIGTKLNTLHRALTTIRPGEEFSSSFYFPTTVRKSFNFTSVYLITIMSTATRLRIPFVSTRESSG